MKVLYESQEILHTEHQTDWPYDDIEFDKIEVEGQTSQTSQHDDLRNQPDEGQTLQTSQHDDLRNQPDEGQTQENFEIDDKFSLVDGQTIFNNLFSMILSTSVEGQTDFDDVIKQESILHDMNLITADGEWIQSTLSRTDEQTIFDDCDISTHTDVLTDFIEYSNYFVTDGWTDLIKDDKSHCGSELTNMDGIQHLLMLYCVGINHEFWIALSVIMNGEAAVSPIMIFQHYLFRVHWDPGSVLVSFDYFDTCVWGAHSLEISSLTCMQLS